LGYVNIQL